MENQNPHPKPKWGKGSFTKALLANAAKHNANTDDCSLSPGAIQRLINPMRSNLGLPTLKMDSPEPPPQVPQERPPQDHIQNASFTQPHLQAQAVSTKGDSPSNLLLNASFLMDTLAYDSFNLSRSGTESMTNSSVRIPADIQEDTRSFLIPQYPQSVRKDESFRIPLKSSVKNDLHASRNLSCFASASNNTSGCVNPANDTEEDSYLANRKFNRNPRPEEDEFQMNADFSKISLLCPERSRFSAPSPSFQDQSLGSNFMTSNIENIPEESKDGEMNFSIGKLGEIDDYSFLGSHEIPSVPETRKPLHEMKENNLGPVAAAAAVPKSVKKVQNKTKELDKYDKSRQRQESRKSSCSSDKKGKKNSKRKSSGWKFASESVQGKEYLIIKQLGKGGSGEVSLVIEKETRELYALKRVNLAGIHEDIVKECINEVEMLEGLKDSDLVVHICAWEVNKTDKTLKIVMEHGQCDLNSSVRSISCSVLKVKYVWETMLTIVDTIHKRGVVHSDLKPANFIWVGDKLKIIDFGIASRLQQDQTSIAVGNPKGTVNFMSPESVTADISGRAKVSTKSDIWSLGCILHLILFGKTPFQHISNSQLKLRAIGEGKVDFSTLPFVNTVLNPYRDEFESILKSCFQRDYRHRSSCQELLSSRFLQRS